MTHTKVHQYICSMVTNATGPVKCTWAIGTRPAVAVSRAAATPRDLTRDIYVCGCHNRQGGPIPTNICHLTIHFTLHLAVET